MKNAVDVMIAASGVVAACGAVLPGWPLASMLGVLDLLAARTRPQHGAASPAAAAIPRPTHPVVSHCHMKCHVQLDIIRYKWIFHYPVESSSSQTECFLLRIYSDSCSMRILLLCDC